MTIIFKNMYAGQGKFAGHLPEVPRYQQNHTGVQEDTKKKKSTETTSCTAVQARYVLGLALTYEKEKFSRFSRFQGML